MDVNNSTVQSTSAHETGEIVLTGNPFTDLSQFGFDLHKCIIRYRFSHAVSKQYVTGEFNISGRVQTGRGDTYGDLIHYIVQKQLEYRRYVSECHKKKRNRNWLSWLTRHPEYMTCCPV
ncbi:MAG: hypothetical protein LUE98_11905 [Tannerellaceae bacterium]|nr:hypothetical protein [Tannerellaceae bacterium]